jgi:hypothetical protein
MNRRAILVGCIIGLLAASAATGATHEEAVLRSSQSSVSAGASLELIGSDFAASETYQLMLLGVLNEYDVGEIAADSAGTFTHQLTVPANVVPGAYQVVAVASDGDVVARLDVTILEGSAGGIATQAGEGSGGADQGGDPSSAARHDDIRIERDRSGIEWGVICLVIGLAGGVGFGLVRRAAA